MKIIERIWLSYREAVIPRDASSVQLQECRRAFYAGALGLFTEIINILEPGQEATEKDLQTMTRIHAELVAFKNGVVAGMN